MKKTILISMMSFFYLSGFSQKVLEENVSRRLKDAKHSETNTVIIPLKPVHYAQPQQVKKKLKGLSKPVVKIKTENKKIVTKIPAVIEPETVFVEGGSFLMGNPKPDPENEDDISHKVIINSFYIGKYEVTQLQWKAVMGKNSSIDDVCPKCPVEVISWNEIQLFLKKLSEITGKHYMLPTEAEWEFAARGGNKSKGYKYSGSNNIDRVAWYSEYEGDNEYAHEVGRKKPNELGLYDMTGNTFERCADWYGEKYYKQSPANNPKGPLIGYDRVVRGGSTGTLRMYSNVYYRFHDAPDGADLVSGFRVVYHFK